MRQKHTAKYMPKALEHSLGFIAFIRQVISQLPPHRLEAGSAQKTV
jgi:hypothetical protein